MSFLLDSNVLIYSVDTREGAKNSRAIEIIQRAVARDGVCSTQSLSEFANVAFKRLKQDVSPSRVYDSISSFERSMVVYPPLYWKPYAESSITSFRTTTRKSGPRRSSIKCPWC